MAAAATDSHADALSPLSPALAPQAPADDQLPELLSAASPAASTETSEALVQLKQLAGVCDLRLRVTGDRKVALIDVAMLFTGLDNNAAGHTVRRVLDAFPAVRTRCPICQFPGAGQRPIHVAPIAVAIEFAFLLPGRRASQLRMQAARLLVRYVGGDLSLLKEVQQLHHVQQALASAPPESLTQEQQAVRACGAAVELDALPKTRKRSIPEEPAVEPEPLCLAEAAGGELFTELVKAGCPGCKGRALKALCVKAYAEFVRLVGQDEQRTEASVRSELASSLGARAAVPEKWQALAQAAVEASLATDGPIAAEGPAAASAEADDHRRKRPSRAPRPFLAEAEHGAAKDAANALWIQQLRPGAVLFFLDS